MVGELWGLGLWWSAREPPSDERRSNLAGLSGSGAGGCRPQRRAGGLVSALIGVTAARCRIELAAGDRQGAAAPPRVPQPIEREVRAAAPQVGAMRKGWGN